MRQIVIASDRPPKELAEIEDRLRSRFEWGLIADIQPPDLETKVAILQKKAETDQVVLPTDVALFIASNIRSNVRELEGALIRLTAYASLAGRDLTLQTAQEVLKNLMESNIRKISIESIQKAVSEQFALRLSRNQSQEQLARHRLSPADRHVPGQAPYRCVPAGDRAAIWRQAPHHGSAFGREDRSAAQDRQGFEQDAQ